MLTSQIDATLRTLRVGGDRLNYRFEKPGLQLVVSRILQQLESELKEASVTTKGGEKNNKNNNNNNTDEGDDDEEMEDEEEEEKNENDEDFDDDDDGADDDVGEKKTKLDDKSSDKPKRDLKGRINFLIYKIEIVLTLLPDILSNVNFPGIEGRLELPTIERSTHFFC